MQINKEHLFVPLYREVNFSLLKNPPVFSSGIESFTELDPVIKNWADTFYSSKNVYPSSKTLYSVNTFYTSLSSSLKSKIIYLSVFAPDDVGLATLPIYQIGGISSSQNNFNNDDLNRDGLKGDGISKYISNSLQINNFNPGEYGASLLITEMANFGGNEAYFGLSHSEDFSQNTYSLYWNNDLAALTYVAFGELDDCESRIYIATPNIPNFISLNYNTITMEKKVNAGLNNSISIINDDSVCNSFSAPTGGFIPIFAERCYKVDGSPLINSVSNYSSARLGFFALHNCLTNDEISELSIAVSKLRNDFGGMVY